MQGRCAANAVSFQTSAPTHADMLTRRNVETSALRHFLHSFPQLTDLPPYLFLYFYGERNEEFSSELAVVSPLWGFIFCVACLLVGVSPPWGCFFCVAGLLVGVAPPLRLVMPFTRRHVGTSTRRHFLHFFP